MKRICPLGVTLISLVSVSAWSAEPAVIWVGPSDPERAAIAVGGLVDAYMAEQQRIKTQPVVYNKIGIRPAGEGVFEVKPGDVVVRQVEYAASFIGRPVEDFRDAHGMPMHRASMITIKMLNGGFCYASGSKCFFDKDRNGTWDRAGISPKGRPVDVPYEVVELRREKPEGASRELRVQEVTPERIVLQEHAGLAGGSGTGQACERVGPGPVECVGFALEVVDIGPKGTMKVKVETARPRGTRRIEEAPLSVQP